MSIEKKIDELMAALERNTQALKKFPGVSVNAVADGRKIYDEVAHEIMAKTELEKIEAIAEVEPERLVLLYADMVTAFRQYIGKNGRDKATEVLTKFGITGKLTQEQLPEARYQEFLDALK